MTNSATPYVLWVTRDDAGPVADQVLRERAGVQGSGVEVRTRALGRSGVAVIPAGSRDEWGAQFPTVMNVGSNQLPPEGRVFIVYPE